VFSERVYASFLFKDRITNSSFKFREAIRNDEGSLDLKEWVKAETQNSPELSRDLRTYKFAKNFEMNCIRNKYLAKRGRRSTESSTKIQPKDKENRLSVRKTDSEKLKADELRKSSNETEYSQFETLGALREKGRRKEKQATKWWKNG